jgi:periplasmic protein TonB
MTNNELLHASLLDIVFDNRNKEYGAYALRKEYNQRLLVSLGVGISLILFVVLMNVLKKRHLITTVSPIKMRSLSALL